MPFGPVTEGIKSLVEQRSRTISTRSPMFMVWVEPDTGQHSCRPVMVRDLKIWLRGSAVHETRPPVPNKPAPERDKVETAAAQVNRLLKTLSAVSRKKPQKGSGSATVQPPPPQPSTFLLNHPSTRAGGSSHLWTI
jgi:hypothetical protein